MSEHDPIVATRYELRRVGLSAIGFQAVCSDCRWSGPLRRWGHGDLPARELAEQDRGAHP